MKIIFSSVFIFAATLLLYSLCHAELRESKPEEGQIIANCLERFGGLSEENARRLQRYKDWSGTYEEIPCFTNCYLNRMFDFYEEGKGFQQENVIKYFGQPLYSACKHQLTLGNDNCEVAYNGFHCLVKLEDDPFVLIENMKKINTEAKTAMKDCLRKFERFEWDRLKDYSKFPVREPIPCFTRCFLDKLQLFNERTKQWNSASLETKLGVPANSVTNSSCSNMRRRRNRNVCKWMYQEFTCFVLTNK